MILSEGLWFSFPLKPSSMLRFGSRLFSGFPEKCFLSIEYSESNNHQMVITICLAMVQYLAYVEEPRQITEK